MSVALWPATLPQPQVDSQVVNAPAACDAIDVLSGPTRVRLARRHSGATFEFQLWMNADETDAFETWYGAAVANGNGEMFLPWIGGGRVVAFADEYQLQPLGMGWALQAVVVQLRVDSTLCDAEIAQTFPLLRDPWPLVSDQIIDDGASDIIEKDDFPLSTLEPC